LKTIEEQKMTDEEKVDVAQCDLRAAWAVLENLAVSLDQIGSAFSEEDLASNGKANQLAMQQALAAYLTVDLVKAINDARVRLGRYLSDAEAEALSEQIPYWHFAGAPTAASEGE
jgi:hypothetical protein